MLVLANCLLLNVYVKQVLRTRTGIIMWDYNPFWRLALVWVLPSRLGYWFNELISLLGIVLDVHKKVNNLLKTSRQDRVGNVRRAT